MKLRYEPVVENPGLVRFCLINLCWAATLGGLVWHAVRMQGAGYFRNSDLDRLLITASVLLGFLVGGLLQQKQLSPWVVGAGTGSLFALQFGPLSTCDGSVIICPAFFSLLGIYLMYSLPKLNRTLRDSTYPPLPDEHATSEAE